MLVVEPEWVWTPEGIRTHTRVGIDAGLIVELTPEDRHPHVDVRLPGRLLLPGLVDAHSHAFQRAFRGHVQWRAGARDDFWSWRSALYATANALDPDGIEAISALAFLEMAEAGITTVGEFHYVHHQPDGTPYDDPDELAHRVIAAARRVGLRIALLRVVYGRNGPGVPLAPEQRRFGDRGPEAALAAAERLSGHDPFVRIGLAPHSVRAVPREWMKTLASFEGVVHAHVSEQPAENEGCLAEHGASPLEVLGREGLVHDRFTAVHLTWPLPGDVDRLVAAGGRVCACPSTELDLGDGFLPLDARQRLPVCIGSDSQAVIDPLGEARALELHARGLARRRNVLARSGERHALAERLLAAASVVGDRALGGAGEGIVPGAPADLVAVDLRRPAAHGVPPLEAAAFVATPEWISDVWVGGRRIVEGGVHPLRDEVIRAATRHLRQAQQRL